MSFRLRQPALTAAVTRGGHVAPGFEAVAAEFEHNFAERGEVGASFSVVRDGELIVDLWGGLADKERGRAWTPDTLQVVFSGAKGLVAVCLLILIERGLLTLDAPVARYWPEFAARGKGAIRVRDVVAHTARLPVVRSPLSPMDLTEPERLAALIAGQAPERDPRAAFIYHVITHGVLNGELIRRVDGRTVGRFFHDEVAKPLGLDVWIGLPQTEEARVSTLRYGDGWGHSAVLDPDRVAGDDLMLALYHNPPLFPAGHVPWNSREYHAAEIASAGAIGTTRSIARLYSCLARGGEIDGVRLMSPETVALGRSLVAGGVSPTSGQTMAFGVGFMLQTDARPLGPPLDAFGHTGAGGSVHAAWPQHRVGLSYAMNDMRDDPAGDPRSRSLLDALHGALEPGVARPRG